MCVLVILHVSPLVKGGGQINPFPFTQGCVVPSLVKINPCSGSNAEEFLHVCIFNIPQLSPLGVGCGHSCEEKNLENLEFPFSKIV